MQMFEAVLGWLTFPGVAIRLLSDRLLAAWPREQRSLAWILPCVVGSALALAVATLGMLRICFLGMPATLTDLMMIWLGLSLALHACPGRRRSILWAAVYGGALVGFVPIVLVRLIA